MPRGPLTQAVILLTREELREAVLLDVLSGFGDVVRLSAGQVSADVELESGVYVRATPEHRPFPEEFELLSPDGAAWMLGGFGSGAMPGCLTRARSADPGAAVGAHVGFLRLNTHHGLALDDPMMPAGHQPAEDAEALAEVARGVLRAMPGAHAWFVPTAELLVSRDEALALDLRDLFVRARVARVRGEIQMDTLGMHGFEHADVELSPQDEGSVESCVAFALDTAWGQVSGDPLREGATVYGPGGRWYVEEEPRWRDPERPTVRLSR